MNLILSFLLLVSDVISLSLYQAYTINSSQPKFIGQINKFVFLSLVGELKERQGWVGLDYLV